MALAGSSGSSWSTTYALGPEARPSAGEAKVPGGEDEVQANSLLPSTHEHLEPACIQVPPTPGISDVYFHLFSSIFYVCRVYQDLYT